MADPHGRPAIKGIAASTHVPSEASGARRKKKRTAANQCAPFPAPRLDPFLS